MESPTKLFNKNYFLLWQGQTISRVGTNIFSVAMILWLIDFTDKASLLGLMGMLAGIPEVLFSTIGGTIADRYSRRIIIISCDIIKGILILLLTLFFYFSTSSVNLIVLALLVITTLSASVNAFFYPAISASIPDLVPENKLNAANSLSQTSSQLISILGQMIGSTLYFLLGAPLLVFLNGVSFFYSAISEFFITIPQKRLDQKDDNQENSSSIKKEIKEGLKYIWEKKGLKNLVLISAVLNFFTVPVILLFPYYLEKVLLINKAWYPHFLAVYVCGNVIGFLIASMNKINPQIKNKLIFAFIILDASIYGILGFTYNVYIALFLIISSGLMSGFVQIIITSIMQSTTPSEIRGRVFGFLGTLGASLSPVAMGLAGVIADITNKNIPLIYGSCSLIMIVISLTILANKSIHEFLLEQKSENILFVNPVLRKSKS